MMGYGKGGFMKTAFLIVDMQKGCREETKCKAEFDQAIIYINEVSLFFRKKNLPVVFIQDLEIGEPESEAFKCVDALIQTPSDIRIKKKFNNAFWETELDSLLKEQGVDSVVVSGFAAEHCVLFTYNGAIERGYQSFLLQNGIAGYEVEEIKRIQLLRAVISYNALEYFLDKIFKKEE